MKILTSLYKRLSFTKLSCACLFLLSHACTLRDGRMPDKATEDDRECLHYKSSLTSALGSTPIHLYLDHKKEKSTLSIDGTSFEFPTTGLPQQICKGDALTLSTLGLYLEQSVPACKIVADKEGFVCVLTYKTAEENFEQIKHIKRSLLQQAKRVPYLLSRRLTLAENLASLLREKNWDRSLSGFCGVMEASLPSEVPLMLTSKVWKEGLCRRGGDKHHFETALILLTKTVEEIAFMHLLQDEANLAGNLSVHVQNSLLPASGKVWVKLDAAQETLNNVLSAAEKIRGEHKKLKSKKHSKHEKEEAPIISHMPRSCWFPGFSSKDPLFAPGRYMQLWGDREDAPCEQSHNASEMNEIARYFLNTISAETTFELSESNTKPLSLPSGPYHYSVYEFPDKLGTKLEKNLIHQGLFVWNGKQQGLNIAKAE